MQPQIRDAATTLMRRGAAKGRPAPPARFWPGRSCRWRSYSSKSASILLNIDQNRGAVNPVRYLPHLSWCARTLRLSSLPSVAQRLERLSVQRLKSPLEGFSPGVHLRGRCHGARLGGRPARSVLAGAVSTACLSSYANTTNLVRFEPHPRISIPQGQGNCCVQPASHVFRPTGSTRGRLRAYLIVSGRYTRTGNDERTIFWSDVASASPHRCASM